MSNDSSTVFLNSKLINVYHDDEILKSSTDAEFQHPRNKHTPPDLHAQNTYITGEFLIVQGPNSRTAFPIKLGQSVRFGSSANADIMLADIGISRLHFLAYWENELLFICDENSTNGTKVNDKRLSSPIEIKGGDTISIGLKTVIIFNELISENRRSKDERRKIEGSYNKMERRKLPDRRDNGLNAHELQVTKDQFADLFSKYFHP